MEKKTQIRKRKKKDHIPLVFDFLNYPVKLSIPNRHPKNEIVFSGKINKDDFEKLSDLFFESDTHETGCPFSHHKIFDSLFIHLWFQVKETSMKIDNRERILIAIKKELPVLYYYLESVSPKGELLKRFEKFFRFGYAKWRYRQNEEWDIVEIRQNYVYKKQYRYPNEESLINNLRKALNRFFGHIKTENIIQNLPPGFFLSFFLNNKSK